MNGTDQRAHRTATQDLSARLDDLALVVEQLGNNTEWLKRELARTNGQMADVAGHTSHRLDEMSSRQVSHYAYAVAHQTRGFRQRVRWLFLGR